ENSALDVTGGVGHARAPAADDRQRNRRHVDDGPRVPAGHEPRPLLVQPPRLGVALDIAALCVGDERGEIADAGGRYLRISARSGSRTWTPPSATCRAALRV